MMDIMYDIPSLQDVKKVIVDRSAVMDGKKPQVICEKD
jgi:ATP-dependent protease Clp ATPase subunit